ncbi:MAG: hypothetical protein U5J64_00625 [Halobacteriales archaeon]|nr:hypothetical protein [Halobacteriales archaeon]
MGYNKRSLIAGKEGNKYKPIQEYWEGQADVWPAAGFSSRELVEGDWEQNSIVITSENGGRLTISPEYTHPDDVHGMEAKLESSYKSRYP